MTRRAVGHLALCAAVAGVLSCTNLTVAAPKASTRSTIEKQKSQTSARNRGSEQLELAIKTLAAEWESHARDTNTPLRSKSDYFVESPATDLPPDAVISALARSGGSIPETCYIRWQLLSYFSMATDPATVARLAGQLASLYAAAPSPLPHPSLLPGAMSALDREISRIGPSDANRVNDAWDPRLAQWVQDNTPILAYADALFALLPDDMQKLKLRWTDLFDHRLPAGVPVSDSFLALQAALAPWAKLAGVGERRLLAQWIARTADRLGPAYPPTTYGEVIVNDKSNRLEFEKHAVAAPAKPVIAALAAGVANGDVVLPAAK